MTTESEAIAETFRSELARRRLLDFGALCFPNFQAPKHIQYLAGLLERVEAGGVQRVSINAPPGHGKSSLLNLFCAWALGRDPSRRILAISANESLAKRNSRAIQSLLTSDFWPWPEIKLTNDSVLEWQTNFGGGCRAIGRSGVVSGFRCEILISDDLQPDAGSEATRQSDLEFFKEVLSTRLEPDGAVTHIQTRWSDTDLTGCLAEGESADDWTFVNLPALALSNDVLGREEGACLWPERWSLSSLLAKQVEIGSGAFASLYQGDPVPSGGALFKTEWLEHRYDALPPGRAILPSSDIRTRLTEEAELASGARPARRNEPLLCIQAIDSAWKTGLQNDRSAIITLATDGKDIFVIDCWAGKLEFTDLQRKLVEMHRKWQPSRVYVEGAASGYALVETLKRSTGIPIIEVPVGRESKIARAEQISGVMEAGRIKLPRSASWLPDLLHELQRIPHGRHDDQCDALVLGVKMLLELIRRGKRYRSNRELAKRLEGWQGR